MAEITVDTGEGGSYTYWVPDATDAPVNPDTNPQVPQPPSPPNPADFAPDPPGEVYDENGYPTAKISAALSEAKDRLQTDTSGYPNRPPDPSAIRIDARSGLPWGVNGDGTPITEGQYAARAAERAALDAKAILEYRQWVTANGVADPNLPPLPEGVTQEEVNRFLAYQAGSYNTLGPGTIKDVWASQGITDPATKAILVQQAIEQIQRANRREEGGVANSVTVNIGGVTFTFGNKLDPWNDKSIAEAQARGLGDNVEAYTIALKMKEDPAFARAFAGENGWDASTAAGWQLKVLDPKAWAAQNALTDKTVIGPYATTSSGGGGGGGGGGALITPNGVTGAQYNGGSTTVVTTSVSTAQAKALADASVSIGARLQNFYKANPSNAIRRRSALPLVSTAVDQANANTAANLNASSTQASTASQAASAPGVPVVTTTTNTVSGQTTTTSVAAATNNPVSYVTDASLTLATEIAIGAFTAPLVTNSTLFNTTGGFVPPDYIPVVPIIKPAPDADPLAEITNPPSPPNPMLTTDQPVVYTAGNPSPTKGENFVAVELPDGTYEVINVDTNETVAKGLTQREADAEAVSLAAAGIAANKGPDTPNSTTTQSITPGTPAPAAPRYVAVESPDGGWIVYDNKTGEPSQATTEAAARSAAAVGNTAETTPLPITSNTTQSITTGTPASTGPRYVAVELPDGGWGVWDNTTGELTTSTPTTQEAATSAAAVGNAAEVPPPALGSGSDAQTAATEQNVITILAQKQATLQAQTVFANNGDWRVKLSLADGAQYLYNDPDVKSSQSSILWPLKQSRGVIFPYTPQIDTSYKAEYATYDLTHSNYRGYFYKGSSVEPVTISAMFTAQDTFEANYLLAVIHFFRSVTKMFYGQDAQRGVPPPLVFLTGLGSYQFNGHPCVVSNFNYSLPKDVDYIRAKTANVNGTNLLSRRDRQTQANNPISSAVTRLQNLFSSQGITKGATYGYKPSYTVGLDSPTYVPTKMDMTITLFPIQSRADVSQVFSLKDYATGSLLRRGFW